MNYDDRDITFGPARIPYCVNSKDGDKWALPGRTTTDDPLKAARVAQGIAEIMEKEERSK